MDFLVTTIVNHNFMKNSNEVTYTAMILSLPQCKFIFESSLHYTRSFLYFTSKR